MNKESLVLKRFYIVAGLLFIVAVAVVFRLSKIQFTQGDEYRAMAAQKTTQNIPIKANRGNIYAQDGSLLATSVSRYDVRFDAVTVSASNFEELMPDLARSLGQYFGRSTSYYQNILQKARLGNRRYQLIARDLNYTDFLAVKQMPLLNMGPYKGGLIVVQKPTREHPMGKIAERLVGHNTTSDTMRYTVGLEAAYDSFLRGQDGHRLKQKIAKGQWKPVSDENELEPRDGFDVVTTIDINIQDIAHHALLTQLEHYEAEHGTVVVMEVETGAVRALANLGRTSKGTYYEKLNYAVGESHEPGSTFKTIAFAAALEDRAIDTAQIVDTRLGSKAFYGRMITDTKGHGKISAARALEVSSNIGLASLIDEAYSEEPELWLNYFKKWRLDTVLGLPISGEGRPEIPRPGDRKWSRNALPSMAYGYNLRLTPLQILTFYNALANKGSMVKPRFVDRIISDNKTIHEYTTEVINPKIMADETLTQVCDILENIVIRGTGRALYSEYFSIAGKTGTARTEYWLEDWEENPRYISSFAGYFPAEYPKYSCIVVIHKPSIKKGYYGADVTGPVFKRIAQKIYTDSPLRDTIQLPEEPLPELMRYELAVTDMLSQTPEQLPDLRGLALMDAIAVLENLGIRVEIRGSGAIVNQDPRPGTALGQTQKVILIGS